MSPALVIDPALLAIPAVVDTEGELLGSLGMLRSVASDLRGGQKVAYFVLGDATEYLARCGLFPLGPAIRSMLLDRNLGHVFDAEDIRRCIMDILNRADDVKALSNVEFCVPISCVMCPPLTGARPELLTEAAYLSMAHVILLYRRTSRRLAGVLLLCPQSSETRVKITLSDISPPLGPETASDFEVTILTPSSADEFETMLDPFDIWATATENRDLERAIRMLSIRISRENGCVHPNGNCREFIVGSGFLRSLGNWQAGGCGRFSATTLEACARLVAQLEKSHLSEYLEGGKHKTRAIDGAQAFRTHITKDHEGLRLMFWIKSNGSFELANVGSKHELQIIE